MNGESQLLKKALEFIQENCFRLRETSMREVWISDIVTKRLTSRLKELESVQFTVPEKIAIWETANKIEAASPKNEIVSVFIKQLRELTTTFPKPAPPP